MAAHIALDLPEFEIDRNVMEWVARTGELHHFVISEMFDGYYTADRHRSCLGGEDMREKSLTAISIRIVDYFEQRGANGNYSWECPGGVVRPIMKWIFDLESTENNKGEGTLYAAQTGVSNR